MGVNACGTNPRDRGLEGCKQIQPWLLLSSPLGFLRTDRNLTAGSHWGIRGSLGAPSRLALLFVMGGQRWNYGWQRKMCLPDIKLSVFFGCFMAKKRITQVIHLSLKSLGLKAVQPEWGFCWKVPWLEVGSSTSDIHFIFTFWGQVIITANRSMNFWVRPPGSNPTTACVPLNKSLHFSGPQCPHLFKRDKNSTYHLGLLWALIFCNVLKIVPDI